MNHKIKQLFCRHTGTETISETYRDGLVRVTQILERTCIDCGKVLMAQKKRTVPALSTLQMDMVYDVLVEEANASELNRPMFIVGFEYNFGKKWSVGDGLRLVATHGSLLLYSAKALTPKRADIIERTNARLAELVESMELD